MPQQKEFDPYGEITEINGLPLNSINGNNENFNPNNDENDVPSIVTYRGYTPFQIRVIIIFIFCVIYGILEEFNYIRVPSNMNDDTPEPQPVTLPDGWSSTFRGGKRKKRQTKKHRVKKRNKRKTKTKKKTKRN